MWERLSKNVLPKSYGIELFTNEEDDFHGKVIIALDILEPVPWIALDALDLSFTSTPALKYSGSDQILLASSVDVEDGRVRLHFFDGERQLEPGRADLIIEFEGRLNQQLEGFYRSSYANGERSVLVAAGSIRRVFPCWDDPAIKSIFRTAVHVPSDRVALSNMPVMAERVHGNTKVVEFAETAIMAAYLFSVVIGDFDCVETRSQDGVLVRLFTRSQDICKGMFALNLAEKVLTYYNKYFGLAYPLPKLDLVSIPEFKAGALEDFGLIIFRDIALLVKDDAPASHRQHVAVVMAHEIAHMWFGNIVTMEWWSHTWLNEGLATWISFVVVEHFFPEWNIWNEMRDCQLSAYDLDSLEASHPIEVEVKHPREIVEVFDQICYDKGASLIYMLQEFLGLEDIQRGLAFFVNKFKFGCATSDDLWDAFSHVTGKEIKEMMTPWTKQWGYPVIHVKLEDNKLTLQQSQFLASGNKGSGKWVVPLTYCLGSYANKASWLLKGDMASFALQESDKGLWVKLNVGQTGFYRVQYDNELDKRLRIAVGAGHLGVYDRLGFLNDTYALCKARKQPLVSLLSLLETYRGESDFAVLDSIVQMSGSLSCLVEKATPDLAQSLNMFLASLLIEQSRRLGWKELYKESHQDGLLRGTLLHMLVHLGHVETVRAAKERFPNLPNVSPSARKAIYLAMAKYATTSDPAAFEALLLTYTQSTESDEKTRILRCIASSSDPELVLRALDFSISTEVSPQDIYVVLSGLNTANSVTAWKWFKEHWNEIFKKLGRGFLLKHSIGNLTTNLRFEGMATEIEEFFTSLEISLTSTMNEAVESSRVHFGWLQQTQREEDEIRKQLLNDA